MVTKGPGCLKRLKTEEDQDVGVGPWQRHLINRSQFLFTPLLPLKLLGVCAHATSQRFAF